MEEIVKFLNDIKNNNNKAWFDKNRDRYESTRNKFLYITEILINEIRSFDSSIGHQDPKDCMFRIFRDLRFSPDKTPYKSNYCSTISAGGRNGSLPGYYFQIGAETSFWGCGVYMPQPDILKKVRDGIFNNIDEFLDILNDPDLKDFQLYDEQKLKTVPKGYPKDWEYADLLKYRSYSPIKIVSNDLLLDPNIIEIVVSDFRKLHRMSMFLNEAIAQ